MTVLYFPIFILTILTAFIGSYHIYTCATKFQKEITITGKSIINHCTIDDYCYDMRMLHGSDNNVYTVHNPRWYSRPFDEIVVGQKYLVTGYGHNDEEIGLYLHIYKAEKI